MSDLVDEGGFRAIADCTYDWESWIDGDGRLTWVNPAVERITGYRVEECLAMPGYPLPLVDPDDLPLVQGALREAAEGSSGNDVAFRVLRRDGERRWVAISWQPLIDRGGRHLGFRTSVRDIHARKMAEERLREAMQAAEQANRAKSEFLAVMSHELRTPMQCIGGYTELLRATDLAPRQRRYLDIIAQQNDLLLSIVGDVLDMSALQSGSLPLESRSFSPRGVVRETLRAASPGAAAKGLKLRSSFRESVPRYIAGDPLRFRQVLANLVGNAIKFTHEGSVRVEARRERGPEGDLLRVSVIDTGIGIEQAKIPKVFLPFAQADSSTARRYGGSGLGLAICKQLCERMGGSVGATSEPGVGSCFWFSLPLRSAPAPRAARSAGPRRKQARPVSLRILVVDDSPLVVDVVVEFCRALGHEVLAAGDGHEAIALLERLPFDLLLIDVHMPGMDGVEAAGKIRAAAGAGLHVVALTADMRARERAPAGLFDGWLYKPVRPGELRSYIEEHLTRRPGKALAAQLREAAAPGAAARLAGRFEVESAATLGELRGALERQDRAAIKEAAHKLKGLLLFVEASGEADAARRLEETADGDLSVFSRRLARLEPRVAAVARDLARAK